MRPRERSLSPGPRPQRPESTDAVLPANLPDAGGSADSMHPVDQHMNTLNVRRPSTVTNPSSVDAIAGMCEQKR